MQQPKMWFHDGGSALRCRDFSTSASKIPPSSLARKAGLSPFIPTCDRSSPRRASIHTALVPGQACTARQNSCFACMLFPRIAWTKDGYPDRIETLSAHARRGAWLTLEQRALVHDFRSVHSWLVTRCRYFEFWRFSSHLQAHVQAPEERNAATGGVCHCFLHRALQPAGGKNSYVAR